MAKLTAAEQIKDFLKDGVKSKAEMSAALSIHPGTLSVTLSKLVKRGEIKSAGTARYVLIGAPAEANILTNTENLTDKTAGCVNERSESDNIETINKILNLYDILLENLHVGFEMESGQRATIPQKIDLIKSLRWLSATVDQLMKRWYLVHRGYDNNARQAQEDAKAKARKVEREDVAGLPPEDRVVVVGEYDNVMKELWDNLPESEQEKRTV